MIITLKKPRFVCYSFCKVLFRLTSELPSPLKNVLLSPDGGEKTKTFGSGKCSYMCPLVYFCFRNCVPFVFPKRYKYTDQGLPYRNPLLEKVVKK